MRSTPDGRDDTVVDAPFTWNPDIPLSSLRIGYIKSEFERVRIPARQVEGEAAKAGLEQLADAAAAACLPKSCGASANNS